ncbi:CrcB-like protein-domain-containing protein [Pestalotiopsis sp. NC0098]|nr:CrcB-like protein-domain-containing protein [Pestalotiopsis sp. NC0098]
MSPSQSYSPRSKGDDDDDDGHELSSIPEDWQNLSELEAPAPVQDPDEAPRAEYRSLEDEIDSNRSRASRQTEARSSRKDLGGQGGPQLRASDSRSDRSEDVADAEEDYSAPPEVANLTEAVPDSVVDNPEESHLYTHHSLEEELGQSQASARGSRRSGRGQSLSHEQSSRPPDDPNRNSRVATEIYIFSHLVFFSILGTLARLGLTALTTYPADVIRWGSLWPNFAGTFILGFLSEGAELLHHPAAPRSISRPRIQTTKESKLRDVETSPSSQSLEAAQPAEQKPATPIPLHIGLATGFCGSLTSFSAFMRDCFDALSGILVSSSAPPSPGQDFMSIAAVVITTMSLCVAALKGGAHLAILMKTADKRLPRRVIRCFDKIVLILGIGCWVGAIIMCVIPPDRFQAQETWRGEVLFALVFAPAGCLLRFILSIKLNLRIFGFPLGTFSANILGTMVLAVVWDLQRIPNARIAGNIGANLVPCQVLQGIEDGFCGCLTTVSTWLLELSSLRRRHAYRYGAVSFLMALAVVITTMGSLKWTIGLDQPVCTSI